MTKKPGPKRPSDEVSKSGNPGPERPSDEVAKSGKLAQEADNTVKITVDGKEVTAHPGELVIAAAERSGVYIPRFCYHPRMSPVGMCRMCLVNVEGPRGTSMQVSCMLTVNEGMKVDTQAPEVKKAQDGVLEFLLINHPLDCPVCDKGGECPLQDQTLAFGPGETRFIEEKRHFEKPISISPLVALDRERCILCDRCTRFSKEVAGDPLIHFQNRGNETQINVFPDHPFASYFSGNTVQICPVGALTATPYRFKARPWDLEQVESTCTSCSVGCRVAVQSSGDVLTRYLGVDAAPTNHGWLCDKGRFDFEALNSEARLTAPLMKKTGQQVEVSWGEALDATAAALKSTSPDRIGFMGGARLANEDQYVWAKLAKSVIGTDNVDAQLGDGLLPEAVLGVPRATIDEACNAQVVVLLAPDLKEELPVLFLRLREAVLGQGLRVIEIASQPTSFTSLAEHHLGYRTGDAAQVVAGLLGLGRKSKSAIGEVPAAEIAAARSLIGEAGDIVVVAGRQSMAESSQSISEAIGLFAQHTTARLLPALRRSNILGAFDMGLSAGLLPGRVSLDEGNAWFREAWGSVPDNAGLDTTGMLLTAASGNLDVLVLLGADPLKDFPSREQAQEALARVPTIICVDILPNSSVLSADIVLPAAGYGERSGATTNIEGRVSRLGQKITAPGVAWPDWMIATELAYQLGSDMGIDSLEGIWDEIEAFVPSHIGVTRAVLGDAANRDGVLVTYSPDDGGPAPDDFDPQAWPGIAEVEVQGDTSIEVRQAGVAQAAPRRIVRPKAPVPARLSYRVKSPSPPPPVDGYAVRLVAGRKLYDQGTLVQHSAHLAGLVTEHAIRTHPSTLAPLGIESGGQVRIVNGQKSMLITVETDEAIARGTAVLPFNVSGDGPADFIDATQPVTNLKVETP